MEFKMKSNVGITVIALALFTIAGATSMAMFQGQRQSGESKIKEPATIVQDGEMTERQKQHAKLFKHSGPKLRDIAARQTGDIEVEEGEGLMMVLPQPGSQRPLFQSAVCNADAVVIGTIGDKSSQLTADETFVFTDYRITVEEVIKNNAAAPIQVAGPLTATRDGGVIELNNRVFRARREDFDPPLVGQRYLLFLRFIPATGAYLTYGNGTFQLEAQRVGALGPAARTEITKSGFSSPPTFLSQIRTFATSDCRTK
jgi:hypothetical protein